MEKKMVLVVEDDFVVAAAIGRHLESLNYGVMYAEDGERGLGMAESADVVFLDLKLPDIPGEAVLERIRLQGNYVPVVVMSAIASRAETVERLKKLGIVDFMAKPFTLRDVAEKVGKAAETADEIGFVGKATDRLKGFIQRQNRA